jgi:ribosomal protein L10
LPPFVIYIVALVTTPIPQASLETAVKERRYPLRKQYLFSEYKKILDEADPLFIVQYPSMPVSELTQIRIRLDQEGEWKMKVIKTGLMRRVLKDVDHSLGTLSPLFHAPVAIIIPRTLKISPDDDSFAKPMRKLNEILGKDRRFYILGAKIEQMILGFSAIQTYFSSPSKKELHHRLLGLLELPMYDLVGTLISPPQTLSQSLEHYIKSQAPST